jgi:hypothetical protein
LAISLLLIKRQKKEIKQKETMTYTEKMKAKVSYENDADRIRQLNLLSPNESKFMRILQHEFTDQKIIVKDKRFYIADQDNYPIAIFEYRDGSREIRTKDKEDGIPLFMYKAILSAQRISKDKIEMDYKK